MKKQAYETRQRNRKLPGQIQELDQSQKRNRRRRLSKSRYTAAAVIFSLLLTMQPTAATASGPAQKSPMAVTSGQSIADGSDQPAATESSEAADASEPSVSEPPAATEPSAEASASSRAAVSVSGQPPAATEDSSALLDQAKDKAMAWLQGQLDQEPETGLPNDTLDILLLLRNEGNEQDVSKVCGWEKLQQGKNTDQDARYAAALCDRETMEKIMERQNLDGGFGLTDGYQSDPLDTLLVLQGLQQCGMEQEKGALISYFESVQHENGGYSYTGQESPDPWLTARIGHELLLSGRAGKAGAVPAGQSRALQGVDAYIQSGAWDTLSETDFLESAWASVYSYERGLPGNAAITGAELLKLQHRDGSFHGNIRDTAAAVHLINAMKSRLESITTGSMQTDCSTHILEAGQKNTVQVTVSMDITVMKKQTLQLTVQAENRGQASASQTVTLSAVSSRQGYRETLSAVFDQPEYREGSRDYTIHTMLCAGGKCLWETTDIMAVRKKEDRQLRLRAEVETGQACRVRLDWNDISDEETTYGYRLWRQTGDLEWKPRSTWDGRETVKVLNVYPSGADYLKKWMNTAVSDSGETAGRGVLDIDGVSFRQYNEEPEACLKDENGSYKYDVIMIGSADCNGGWDLSEEAYQATLSFTETGRGILFGHDSVVDNRDQVHPNLARFGKQLGIVFHREGSGVSGNRVEIINNGFLTSYPWKLSGSKSIPYTHTSAQFVDTTLADPATSWMRFAGYDTGDNAYLLTRNQYAMIQTGHSNGQATDDERKIMANTLFYLKQMTGAGQAEDKSFYDEDAPAIASAQAEEDGIHITAADRGTDYRYRVEGVPQGEGKETQTRESNVVEATALSGIRGYLMSMDESPKEDGSLAERNEDGSLKAEILTLQQESGGAEPSSLQEGTLPLPSGERGAGTWYIHLRAVDYAGNISEETTLVFQQKEDRQPWFQTGYGLFSMEGDLNLNCCEAEITGDIYSGKDFNFGGSILSVRGLCRTAGNPNIYGWKLDVPHKITTEPLSMPDYREGILRDMQQENGVQELVCYNSTEIREPVVCSRTTGAWCPDLKINAGIACRGDISLNTNTLSAGDEEPVVVMSQKGDITVNCTDFQFNGLLYAPEGTVSINVFRCRLAGTIIAKEIKLSGTYFKINQPDAP